MKPANPFLILRTAIIIFIISTVLIAQDKNKNKSEPKDTNRLHMDINQNLKINYELNQFYPSFIINRLQPEMFFNDDSSTIWLRTKFALSYPSQFNPNAQKAAYDLTQPLYRQYIENSKFNTVTYILGMAQTAAVGYAAYLHIKKYGFWK